MDHYYVDPREKRWRRRRRHSCVSYTLLTHLDSTCHNIVYATKKRRGVPKKEKEEAETAGQDKGDREEDRPLAQAQEYFFFFSFFSLSFSLPLLYTYLSTCLAFYYKRTTGQSTLFPSKGERFFYCLTISCWMIDWVEWVV